MVDFSNFTRPHKIGTIFFLEERHFDGPIPDVKFSAYLGRAVDCAVKEYVVLHHRAIPTWQYAKYDFLLDDLPYEIKSSDGANISISDGEYKFGCAQMREGKDVIYMLYRRLEDHAQYEFVGYTLFSILRHKVGLAPSVIDDSMMCSLDQALFNLI